MCGWSAVWAALGLRDGDGGVEAGGEARLDGPQQAGAGGEQRLGQQRGGRGRQHGRKRNLHLYLY